MNRDHVATVGQHSCTISLASLVHAPLRRKTLQSWPWHPDSTGVQKIVDKKDQVKKIVDKKNQVKTIVGPKKYYGPKKVCVQNIKSLKKKIWSKKMGIQKNKGSKRILGQKTSCVKNIFCVQNIWVKQI